MQRLLPKVLLGGPVWANLLLWQIKSGSRKITTTKLRRFPYSRIDNCRRVPSSVEMNYRRLGRWGVKVSEVALGGWLTHGRSIDDDAVSGTVKTAFDCGINFFDTADAYNAGKAEISLGHAIKQFKRQDLFLATKCYFPISQAPNDRGLSRKHIYEAVDKALTNLQTDYLDLMQCHRFDTEAPLDETVRAFEDLIRSGKVLYWGVSEWQSHQIADAVRLAEHYNGYAPASNQPRYSMLARGIESSILPTCEANGMGVVVFSPLAQGVLTGKYKPGEPLPTGSRGSDESSNMFMRGMLDDQDLLQRIQKLGEFAADHSLTLNQLALAWCLRKPGITSVIIGATSVEQVQANASASGITLSDDEWQQAEEILQP